MTQANSLPPSPPSSPPAPPPPSPLTHLLSLSLSLSRRELFAKASAVLAGAAFVEGASAKAGQFGKLSVFDMEDISSPYVPGGPKSGKESTYGYAKSEGDILADGYQVNSHLMKRERLHHQWTTI